MINLNKLKIMAILGISGSGKSYFAKELQKRSILDRTFNKTFLNLKQVTTRGRRVNDPLDNYLFTDKETYMGIKARNKLFGITIVNDEYYGTLIPDDFESLVENEVSFVAVLNYMGYCDLLNYVNGLIKESDSELRAEDIVLPVFINTNGAKPIVTREGRHLSSILKELHDIEKIEGMIEVDAFHEDGSYTTFEERIKIILKDERSNVFFNYK